MFCIKCGAKNPDGSKFCSTCGSAMAETQKNDKVIIEENSSSLQNNRFSNTNSPAPPAVSNTQPSLIPTVPQSPIVSNMMISDSGNSMTDSGNSMKVRCPRCKSEKIITMTKTSTTTTTSGYKGGLGCLGWLMLGPLGLLCGLCGMGSKTKVKHSNYLVCQECGNEFLFLNDKLRELKVGAIQSFVIGVLLIILCFSIFKDSVLYILISLIIGVLLIIVGVFAVKEYQEVKLKGYEASCYKKEE